MPNLIIVADAKQPLVKHVCANCGNVTLGSKDAVTDCPYCGEQFEQDGSPVKTSVAASLSNKESFNVECTECKATMSVYNSDHNAISFALARFCPCCGESALDAPDNAEDTDDSDNPQADTTNTDTSTNDASNSDNSDEDSNDSGFNNDACSDSDCEEVNSCTDENASNSDNSDNEDDSGDLAANKEQAILDTQKDVQEALDNSDPDEEITEESLQWKTLNDDTNGQNGTLMAFSASTGNPLFVFRKEDCSDDVKSIFGSSMMISAFNQIAAKDGIGMAVKKLGGRTFSNRQLLTSNFIDSMVSAKVKSEVLPKLIECMALAVDGALKGVYPQLRKDIADGMTNELIGSGLPRERVTAALASALGNGGMTVFASIIKHAVDLMKKSEPAYNEAKSMIASAQYQDADNFDIERNRVVATLNASSNIVLGNTQVDLGNKPSNFANDVAKLRERLKFSKKF